MTDPKIIDISGFLKSFTVFGVVVPIYYLVISIAFIASMIFLVRHADEKEMSRNRALDVSLVLMISGFIGARLFHVFVEEPHYYLEAPLRVFEIWKGGFVWYGGAITGALASLAFLRWKSENLFAWLDLFTPVGSLGYAIGRFACLFAGCCYGAVFSTGSEQRSDVNPDYVYHSGFLIRHPTQLYAIVFELILLSFILFREKSVGHRAPKGQLFFIWMAGHSFGRIIMELFRDDPRGPTFMGMSVSTTISLALIAIAVYFLRRFKKAI